MTVKELIAMEKVDVIDLIQCYFRVRDNPDSLGTIVIANNIITSIRTKYKI